MLLVLEHVTVIYLYASLNFLNLSILDDIVKGKYVIRPV